MKEDAAKALAEWEKIGRKAVLRLSAAVALDRARDELEEQQQALAEAVADLARRAPEADLAVLREYLHVEARRLAETTGHTYQSALQQAVERCEATAAAFGLLPDQFAEALSRAIGGVALIDRLGQDLRGAVQPLFDAFRDLAPKPRRDAPREPKPPHVAGWQLGGIRAARRNRMRRR